MIMIARNAAVASVPEESGDNAVERARIIHLLVASGTVPVQRANMVLDIKGRHVQGEAVSERGPLDAIALAFHKILGREAELVRYKAVSNQEGTGAERTVTILVKIDGRLERSTAKGTDPNLAFARASLGVLNRKPPL